MTDIREIVHSVFWLLVLLVTHEHKPVVYRNGDRYDPIG